MHSTEKNSYKKPFLTYTKGMENWTETEIEREVAYRYEEAIALGRNEARAKAEAEAWRTAILQPSTAELPLDIKPNPRTYLADMA